MDKPTGAARTVGGTMLLISMALRHFGIEFEVSDADVLAISNAVGAGVLAYGVIINIFKRFKLLFKRK